ncbi:hypothetical protein XENOCAPTIV_025446 [Xenoophorus captivus]|uniref:Uncharacterized protein n=1 Tax=Xenoophorus captivus TaxID=1517983 RepID=A0ABV0S3Q4_9TELE
MAISKDVPLVESASERKPDPSPSSFHILKWSDWEDRNEGSTGDWNPAGEEGEWTTGGLGGSGNKQGTGTISTNQMQSRGNMKLLDERIWSLFRRHLQQTLTYWSVFFSFGLCIAFLGPTILDLRCQTQSTLQQITWVFFSQQFFLLVGSSVGGLFKKT